MPLEEEKTTINDEQNKEKVSLKERIVEKSSAVKQWVKDAGDSTKEKVDETKKWFDEKTPEAIEKANMAAEKAIEIAEDARDWVDTNSKKAVIWLEAKKDAEKMRKIDYEFKTLRPIFDDDLPNEYDSFPLINIVDSDEKRSKSEICNDSYGFFTEARDLEVLNIYTSSFDKFDIKVDEDVKEGVYFANPYVSGEYIESSRYATYLKQERVRELVNIADLLGAKYVGVSFKTEEKKAEEQKGKLSLKNGKNKAEAEAEKKLKESLKLSVDEIQEYKGHNNPVRPNLVYYKNDKVINELIEKRINGTNPLIRHTYSVTYATSSTAKMKEATKVDGAIKALKLGASQSLAVCSEVESQIHLSYTIEF